LLDRSPEDIYTPYVCNSLEVSPLVVPVVIDLIDYTKVFFDNVCVRTYFRFWSSKVRTPSLLRYLTTI
jgi:hypothetical protein